MFAERERGEEVFSSMKIFVVARVGQSLPRMLRWKEKDFRLNRERL